MRFSLHGGSVEEETVLRRLAEKLGAEFVECDAPKEEGPLFVVQCLPQRIGMLGLAGHGPQRLDEAPPPERAGGLQDPLPGLDTPPCR